MQSGEREQRALPLCTYCRSMQKKNYKGPSFRKGEGENWLLSVCIIKRRYWAKGNTAETHTFEIEVQRTIAAGTRICPCVTEESTKMLWNVRKEDSIRTSFFQTEIDLFLFAFARTKKWFSLVQHHIIHQTDFVYFLSTTLAPNDSHTNYS